MEKWNTIIGFEGLYWVSNRGRIKSFYTGKILIQHGSGRNREYLKVNLYKDGQSYNKQVHVLVAVAFISNPENKPEVNHIDGNKLNNNDWNLEWVTGFENMDHAFKTGLINGKNKRREVNQIYKGQVVREYETILAAGKAMNVHHMSIWNALNGKQKTSCGFIWKYKN